MGKINIAKKTPFGLCLRVNSEFLVAKFTLSPSMLLRVNLANVCLSGRNY